MEFDVDILIEQSRECQGKELVPEFAPRVTNCFTCFLKLDFC